MEKNIITAASGKYLVKAVTVKELVESAPNLPAMQRVRGPVWKPEVSSALVEDIKSGLYVPPIVLAGDVDHADVSDGQQRLTAIAAAYGKGDLPGDCSVLVAVDAGRSFVESFKVLNMGVPVGSSLVQAASYDSAVTDAIIKLAAHPLFSLYKWTSTQVLRTARAEFASVALAIAAGWATPCSSTKECSAWLKKSSALVDDTAVQTAEDILESIRKALVPYDTIKAVKDKARTEEVKRARKILANMRKKNLFLTAVGVALKGGNMDDYVVLTTMDALLGEKTTYSVAVNGKTRKAVAKWSIGGGSSGSYQEYRDRLIVAMDKLPKVHERLTTSTGEDDAAALADAAESDAAALADALGI